MAILMACGHTSNGTDQNGKECCVICYGITKNATIPATNKPILSGRFAVCADCGRKIPSTLSLPFFEYIPHKEFDSFYCGCRGWN